MVDEGVSSMKLPCISSEGQPVSLAVETFLLGDGPWLLMEVLIREMFRLALT